MIKSKGEIIYISSNQEDDRFEEKIRQNILSVTNLPIISVTQKPINFGKNIAVGSVGVSGFNMFRQILIGLKASDADYVIACESDCLYPPDYFEFVPPDLRTVYRSDKTFILPYKSGCFYGKPKGTSLCQIIGREYYIEILEALFQGAPTWSVEERSFPKERIGQYDIVKKSEIKYFSHPNPIISFKTGKGMRHVSNGQGENVCELRYWGTTESVRKRYTTLETSGRPMKNLLIYTNEEHKFTEELSTLVKIQIDNSLYFWKPKDIILVTNFPYDYKGIKSMVIPDILSVGRGFSNKTPVISYLLRNNLIPYETIWYHDFDAYQDRPLNVETELGFTNYGYQRHINFGSFFFKPTTKVKLTFELINSEMLRTKNTDEKTLNDLISTKRVTDFDLMGIEYNYGQKLHQVDKFKNVEPKVLHFHPNFIYHGSKEPNINIFMHGKNRLNRPLMSDRLISVFKRNGIE